MILIHIVNIAMLVVLAFAVRELVLFRRARGSYRSALGRLVAMGGHDDEADAVGSALTLYEWALDESTKGNLIGSKEPDGTFTAAGLPGITWARNVGRVTGQERGD